MQTGRDASLVELFDNIGTSFPGLLEEIQSIKTLVLSQPNSQQRDISSAIGQLNIKLKKEQLHAKTQYALLFDHVSSALSPLLKDMGLSPKQRQDLSDVLQCIDSPLDAITQLVQAITRFGHDLANTRKLDAIVMGDGHTKLKNEKDCNIVAGDIASSSRRIVSVIYPLIQSAYKDHPDHEELKKLNRKAINLKGNSNVDFFDSLQLMEDMATILKQLNQRKEKHQADFLMGVQEQLSGMQSMLGSIVSTTAIYEKASEEDKEKLDLIFSNFNTAADDESDPSKLKAMITSNLSLLQTQMSSVMKKQQAEYRQLQRELKNAQKAIDSQCSSLSTIRNEMEKARKTSLTDALTGLMNKRAYFEDAENIMRKISEGGDVGHYTLIMIDIDNFKSINDTHGHLIGDKVIQRVGSIVKRIIESATLRQKPLKSSCEVYRVGGEEILIRGLGFDFQTGAQLAELIRSKLSNHNMSWKEKETGATHSLNVTASFGVATMDNTTSKTCDDTYLHADKALYLSKKSGRNRVSFYAEDGISLFIP